MLPKRIAATRGLSISQTRLWPWGLGGGMCALVRVGNRTNVERTEFINAPGFFWRRLLRDGSNDEQGRRRKPRRKKRSNRFVFSKVHTINNRRYPRRSFSTISVSRAAHPRSLARAVLGRRRCTVENKNQFFSTIIRSMKRF